MGGLDEDDGDKGGIDIIGSGEDNGSGGSGSGGGESGEEEDVPELVHIDEDFYYIEHVMRLAAMLHSLVSFCMLIAYYHLKVSTCNLNVVEKKAVK